MQEYFEGLEGSDPYVINELKLINKSLDYIICVEEKLHIVIKRDLFIDGDDFIGTITKDYIIIFNDWFTKFDYIKTTTNETEIEENEEENERQVDDEGYDREFLLEKIRDVLMFDDDEFYVQKIEIVDKNGNVTKTFKHPEQIWKDALPRAKKAARKINRNKVYINEVLGFPSDVALKIAGDTYFGKKSKIQTFLKEKGLKSYQIKNIKLINQILDHIRCSKNKEKLHIVYNISGTEENKVIRDHVITFNKWFPSYEYDEFDDNEEPHSYIGENGDNKQNLIEMYTDVYESNDEILLIEHLDANGNVIKGKSQTSFGKKTISELKYLRSF